MVLGIGLKWLEVDHMHNREILKWLGGVDMEMGLENA